MQQKVYVTLDKQPIPDVDVIHASLLGESCYVNWPQLIEARITSLSSSSVKRTWNDLGQRIRTVVSGQRRSEWAKLVHNIRDW